ncbi:universal stress protein [Pseudomonas gingeri]|uniref:Universal stress protein n=1 Tax=Pseudomonas gingeri TaxID=117681 RepID=A0A7Y7Y974_9PSED|nr:universal stress protein [Pseudomonas gingeri]NWB29826.1 universal stress protein [Pseudomonas gingeri]NWC31962.1 universal stress protein [Pseudomonas gingeri]NWD08856.1 universal stress protein [Pseudomonas gingeri]NWD48558.1 universal stress protein [Pseudomonas gingeri]NWE36266.1 universal stress protein [Pseudomonas gingeri]
MSQYQRLLLITDRHLPQSPALERAAALAVTSGAALHITALVEPPPRIHLIERSMDEAARTTYMAHYRTWLQEVTQGLRDSGLALTTEAIWTEDPLQEILVHARELKPDLLIKDVYLEPMLKRVFTTPLDWQLLQDSPVPVHLVNGRGLDLPRRIVAAVDTSGTEGGLTAFNRKIITTAQALAVQCDAELHLLYAYDLSPAFMSDPSVAMIWVDELREALREPFTRLADEYGVAPEFRHFLMGTPVGVLHDFVRESSIDVVVMGTVQPKGLGKIIGDTTERALLIADCSILTVKPD